MANTASQSYENHTRVVPAYHVVTFGILAINLLWQLYRVVTIPSVETIMAGAVAVALVLLAFYARIFALTVQDRVIRLEMRLRLRELLPPDLRPRIHELTVPQLVALRFASDAELPELARKVLADKITDRKAIKQMIRDWQPDFLRA